MCWPSVESPVLRQMEVGKRSISVTLAWPYFTVLSHKLDSRRMLIRLLAGQSPTNRISESGDKSAGVITTLSEKDSVLMGQSEEMWGKRRKERL